VESSTLAVPPRELLLPPVETGWATFLTNKKQGKGAKQILIGQRVFASFNWKL
jgi:hypothetical protein